MRTGLAVVFVGLFGCTQTGPGAVEETPAVSPNQPVTDTATKSDPKPTPEPQPTPAADGVTVQMTAATLADDCGRGPQTPPPPKSTIGSKPKKAKAASRKPSPSGGMSKGDMPKRRAKRRCEQTSIQLAVFSAESGASATVSIKSVELFLESGESIGVLAAREPSVWTDGDGYVAWDQTVEPGEDLSVSYALSRPDWSAVANRRDHTYTVKAVLTVAGADQTVEREASASAPTSLPPNVKT